LQESNEILYTFLTQNRHWRNGSVLWLALTHMTVLFNNLRSGLNDLEVR